MYDRIWCILAKHEFSFDDYCVCLRDQILDCGAARI